MPFLYIVMLYVAYENVFIRLRLAIDDPALRAYAKWLALVSFRSQTELLNRWTRNLVGMKPKSEKEIKDAIREVKALADRERNPPEVPADRGWSPYAASTFLNEDGLYPGDYHRVMVGADLWSANSPYLEFGKGILPNNIAYYVEGDEFTAKVLKLVMNVSEPDEAKDAREHFQIAAKTLYGKALSEQMPQYIWQHLVAGRCLNTHSKNKKILIVREAWFAHDNGGYTLKFLVMNKDVLEDGGVT